MNIVVYGIKEISTGEVIYVGSTVNLGKRKSAHLTYTYHENYKDDDKPVCKYMRSKCSRKDFFNYFEFVELCSCSVDNRHEKLKLEREYMEKYNNPKCNKMMSYTSEEEKREKHRKYNAEWYSKHPGKSAEYNRRCREKKKQNLS